MTTELMFISNRTTVTSVMNNIIGSDGKSKESGSMEDYDSKFVTA